MLFFTMKIFAVEQKMLSMYYSLYFSFLFIELPTIWNVVYLGMYRVCDIKVDLLMDR